MKYNFKGKEVTIHDNLVPFVEHVLCETVDEDFFDSRLYLEAGKDYEAKKLTGSQISELIEKSILKDLEICHDITFDENYLSFHNGKLININDFCH